MSLITNRFRNMYMFLKEFYEEKRTAVEDCSDGKKPKYLADAFIQSDLQPFIHTTTVWSTMQGG